MPAMPLCSRSNVVQLSFVSRPLAFRWVQLGFPTDLVPIMCVPILFLPLKLPCTLVCGLVVPSSLQNNYCVNLMGFHSHNIAIIDNICAGCIHLQKDPSGWFISSPLFCTIACPQSTLMAAVQVMVREQHPEPTAEGMLAAIIQVTGGWGILDTIKSYQGTEPSH